MAQPVEQMPFGKIYPLLVNKALRKGRTREEADAVICWMTGYTPTDLARLARTGLSYGDFFTGAPALHPARTQITGKVCGVQVETIADPLEREIRRLDKLIDELAKGLPLERILRR